MSAINPAECRRLANEHAAAQAEIERLRRLLSDVHASTCSALAAPVPCDCPWSAGSPLSTAEAARAEIERLRDGIRAIAAPRCLGCNRILPISDGKNYDAACICEHRHNLWGHLHDLYTALHLLVREEGCL